MRCAICGGPISFFRRFSDKTFCSDDHRRKFRREELARLLDPFGLVLPNPHALNPENTIPSSGTEPDPPMLAAQRASTPNRLGFSFDFLFAPEAARASHLSCRPIRYPVQISLPDFFHACTSSEFARVAVLPTDSQISFVLSAPGVPPAVQALAFPLRMVSASRSLSPDERDRIDLAAAQPSITEP